MHYIQAGKAEGRNAKTKEVQEATTVYNGTDYAAVYNYEYYRTNNTDLQSVFGEDSERYLEHFVQSGMSEGRQGSEEFSLSIYKANYADLQAAFGDNNVAYYMHYIQAGKAEGRNAKTLIAPVEGDYIITVDANGGYIGNDTSKNIAVYGGKTDYSLQSVFLENKIIVENSDMHKAFEGWYYDQALTHKVDIMEYVYPSTNITLYAKWVEAYVITFDANGGMFDTGDSIVQLKCIKGKTNYLFAPYAYSREEHKKYDGWTIDKEGTQPFDISNYKDEKDITVYAKWVDCVTVRFDSNGGCFEYINAIDGSTPEIYLMKCKVGDALGTHPYVSNKDPFKLFDGWYFDKEFTKKPDVEMMYLYEPKEDTIFYAKWRDKYRLTMDACGGYLMDDSEKTEIKTIPIIPGDTMSELYVNEPVHKDKHYKFDGWYWDKEYTKPANGYEVAEKDATVYAKWKECFVVTFDANGGYFSNPTSTIRQESYEDGSRYIDGGLPNIDAKDKIFSGWYSDKECTQEIRNGYFFIHGDMTVYAKWEDAYTVTFDGNGGVYGLYDPVTRKMYRKIAVGSNIGKHVETPYDKKNNGKYQFIGWSLNADGTNIVEDVEKYVPTSHVTLYARWHKRVKVTFDANGGQYADSVTQEVRLFNKDECLINSDEPEAASNDQTFAGWYFDKECTKPVGNNYVPINDITVYAKWSESYTITVNANGGSYNSWTDGYVNKETLIKKVVKGNAIGSINKPDKPQDDSNQTFWGWYLDEACTQMVEDLNTYVPTHDIKIYAKWARKPILTLDANGGYFYNSDDDKPTSKTYDMEVNEEIKGESYYAYKSDAVIDGWCLDKECTRPIGSSYRITGDVTLYAKWKYECTIKLVVEGGQFEDGSTEKELKWKANATGLELPNAIHPDQRIKLKKWTEVLVQGACMEYTPYELYNMPITSDMTLKVAWGNICYINYDTQGGKTLEPQETFAGDIIYSSSIPVNQVGESQWLRFEGWYLDKEYTIPFILGETYISQDTTFYAKWGEVTDSPDYMGPRQENEINALVEENAEPGVTTELETEAIQESEDESENSALENVEQETAEILQSETPEAETEVTIQEPTTEESTTEESTIQESESVENSN